MPATAMHGLVPGIGVVPPRAAEGEAASAAQGGVAYLTVVQITIGRSSARCTVVTPLRIAQGRI